MAATSSESARTSGTNHPLLVFLPAGPARSAGEIIASAIPGGVLQFVFIVAAAGLNIWGAQSAGNELYAAVYLPVVCLLPLVVGAISALVLERVQGTSTLHVKGGMISAAVAGLVGGLIGGIVIMATGLLKIGGGKPLGASFVDVTYLVALPLVMAVVAMVMAAIGAALATVIVSRLEK